MCSSCSASGSDRRRKWLRRALFVSLLSFLNPAATAENVDRLLESGLASLQRGQWKAAVASFEEAAQLARSDPRPWLGLARAKQSLGLMEEAVKAAAQTAALSAGRETFVRQGLAIYHAEGNRHVEADRWASLAAPDLAAPQQAALRDLLGRLAAAAGNLESAEKHFHLAVSLNRYEESYHASLGKTLLRQQRFAEAVETTLAARRIFALGPQLDLILGVAYYGQRRFDDAVDALLRVIGQAPDLVQPHLFLSRMLTHAGARLPQVAKAFAAFHHAHPNEAAGPYLHAVALIAQLPPSAPPEMLNEPERLLRRTLELDVDFAESHRELGLLLERAQNYSAAAESLERACQLNPSDSAALYRLARVYDRLGRKEKAEAARVRHVEMVEAERAQIDKHAGAAAIIEPVIR